MSVIETKRLLLRRFAPADADAMIQVFCDPNVMRFSEGVRTPDWVVAWLEKCVAQEAANPIPDPWAVVEKSSGAVMGYCGLFDCPDINGRPEIEIGYRLAIRYWGYGYASEAACAVRDLAFGSFGLTRLIAMIDPQNTASIRVAEKLGMRRAGEVMFPGYTHPDWVYAVTNFDSQLG